MPSAPSACVSIQKLRKNYGQVRAVDDVSLEVAGGEILGLLGLNGAGKTTALECVLGLREADAGSAVVNGLARRDDPVAFRRQIGAVLQAAALQDKLTPREALSLFGAFCPQPIATANLLDRFGLLAHVKTPFAALSGGLRQRLFLALAVQPDPPVLVLDEPTTGLDPASRRDVHALLAGLRAEGRAILLSTHDLEEAETLCDRVAILHQGRLIACAPPAELVARSGSQPALSFRTRHPMSAGQLGALPGKLAPSPLAGGHRLGADDLTAALGALVRTLVASGNTLTDLQIRRPSLEDVFLELTGQTWSEPEKEAAS